MEMLSSFGGDKHEFCLVVIKFMLFRCCPSINITYTSLHRVKWLGYFVRGGGDICNRKSSANEWCIIMCESIMADKVLIYIVKSIGPRIEP